MSRGERMGIEVLFTATAGFLVIVVPVYLDPGHRDYGGLVRNAVEGFKIYSLVLIAAIGFLAGLFGHAPYFILGVATVAVLPAWSILDMLGGHDHNLFPIEFAFYGFYSLFGILGAWLGRQTQRRRQPTGS